MARVKLTFPEAEIMYRQPLTVRIADINYGRHLRWSVAISDAVRQVVVGAESA